MADAGGPQRLTIDVVTPAGVRVPGLARWLQSVAPARARGAMTVAIVPDARVRALNRQYRRNDSTTDVLSFPAESPAEAAHGDRPKRYRARTDGASGVSRIRYLGDIVIAVGVARRQAREVGHSLQAEVRVLALHGLLHLLGYDHEHDEGQMARLERRLRLKGGLGEGLIERARPRVTR